jgi:hypothetical protein
MYWQFTFRNLTQAETVRLETITDSAVEARKLADIHLESIGHPPSAFVSLRPMRSAQPRFSRSRRKIRPGRSRSTRREPGVCARKSKMQELLAKHTGLVDGEPLLKTPAVPAFIAVRRAPS